MALPASEDPPSTTDEPAFARKATYHAFCLTCGAASGELQGRVAAMQWSERHRGETPFQADVVIQSTVLLPSGTLGRFFEHA